MDKPNKQHTDNSEFNRFEPLKSGRYILKAAGVTRSFSTLEERGEMYEAISKRRFKTPLELADFLKSTTVEVE